MDRNRIARVRIEKLPAGIAPSPESDAGTRVGLGSDMLGIDRQAARYTWTAAMVLLLLDLVYLVRSTLFIFILALLFAYLLSPLVNLLDRAIPTKRTRTLALALAYVIFIGVVVLVGVQIGSRVVDAGGNAGRASLPEMLAKIEQPSPMAPAILNTFKAQVIAGIQPEIRPRAPAISCAQLPAGRPEVSLGGQRSDLRRDRSHPRLLLPEGRQASSGTHALELLDEGPLRGVVDDVMADIHLLLAHYMRALVLLSLATFAAYSIFFSIMGVPFGVLLAVLAMMPGVHPHDRSADGGGHHPVGRGISGSHVLAVTHLPGGLPDVSGLLPLAAPDGAGRGVASAAGAVRRFRRARKWPASPAAFSPCRSWRWCAFCT